MRSVVTNESACTLRPTCPSAATRSRPSSPVSRRRHARAWCSAWRTNSRIDFELSAGNVTDTVNVVASATPVRVLGGDVSGVITGEQVRELPLNGRNFLQLATLMPGVSAPDFLNVKDKGLLGGSDLSVSGSDVTANLWTRRRREQQRRRVEPNNPGVPVARGHLRNSRFCATTTAPSSVAPAARRSTSSRRAARTASRIGLLLGPQRRDQLDELFPQDQQPAEGRAEAQRLRRLDRRADHQRQAAFLRQRRVEPRGSRHRARRRSCRRKPSATATSAGHGSPNARSPMPERPADRAAVPRQSDPGQSPQPRRTGVSEPVSAAQRDARLRKLQQLGDVGGLADRLPPVQRPRGLEHQQCDAG